MYKNFGKRFIDVIMAAAGLIILSPLFLLLILLIYLFSQTKPFFCQYRPGLNGKIFRIIKFRTMRDLNDENRIPLPDSQRLTILGKFFRQTSLDELPQLWNVLIGDMSLVGPRPLLPEYLPLYTKNQSRRHAVKPGITGWAQVNGRNSISWDEKFAYDLWYVENISLGTDLIILSLTIRTIFSTRRINSNENQVSGKFTG
ncbi:sugar transferase [Dyadobacter sp. CY345]|uniref:sugar transferase n=1 Tax=Dyadobacter sp. CY345 TaxID=2909335 RepID=UPI001F28F5B1|nr:sugar transferase [Dyadobacter sp. CY345]MCF2445281.1 sugar transferase [Dyadobacter sp. CY345]